MHSELKNLIDSKPTTSRIEIKEYPGDKVGLKFPQFGFIWGLLVLVVGAGLLAWQWNALLAPGGTFTSWEKRLAMLGAACVIVGPGIMLWRIETILDAERIDKRIWLFGFKIMDVPLLAYGDTPNISTKQDGSNFQIIFDMPGRENPYMIEGFSSAEERDWVLKPILALWHEHLKE